VDLKQNYFQLFSIPVAFDVDLSVIKAVYRELQRNLHPDRFANSTASEKLLSMQASSLVNEAKDVLQSPVRRAAYLLELQGHPVDFETNIAMAPDFLMEQMELREALDELKSSSEPEKKLHSFTQRIDQQMDDFIIEFKSLFNDHLCKIEQGEQSALLESTEMVVRKMQFMNKLQIETGKIEEDLFD